MPSIRNALTTTVLAASTFVAPSLAAYSMTDNYEASKFFSMFSFWTQADPTHGYVQYVSQSDAQSDHLIQANSGSVYMGVDMNNTASGSGRKSVRLSSSKKYQDGLFILDVEHMPTGCGTWPAFWLVGPNWPNEGEIDIIEGVNDGTTNKATLHTNAGCSLSSGVSMTGKIANANCDVSSGDNEGCGIQSSDSTSYGAGLNGIKGGVYATEVTDSQITVWFFPRSSIPQDVKSGTPNPTGWSKPMAVFKGCNVQQHFKDMQIVFDTTFCGDWAGQVWSSDSTCSAKASTCQSYVQNHPEGFHEAYWTVNSLKVYSGSSSGASSGSAADSTPSPAGGAPAGSATGKKTNSAAAGTATAKPANTAAAQTAAQPAQASAAEQSAQPSAQPSGAGGWQGKGGRGRPGVQNQKHKRHGAAHGEGLLA